MSNSEGVACEHSTAPNVILGVARTLIFTDTQYQEEKTLKPLLSFALKFMFVLSFIYSGSVVVAAKLG